MNIINQRLNSVNDELLHYNSMHCAMAAWEEELKDTRRWYYDYLITRFGLNNFLDMVKIHKTI